MQKSMSLKCEPSSEPLPQTTPFRVSTHTCVHADTRTHDHPCLVVIASLKRPRVASSLNSIHNPDRGTSLMRNRPSLGPFSRLMPRALWWSYGGVVSFVLRQHVPTPPCFSVVAFINPPVCNAGFMPHGGVQAFVRIFERYVTKFQPHLAINLIA